MKMKLSWNPPASWMRGIKAGTRGEPELERVAQMLADFYQKQPSTPEIARWGEVDKLRISTDENFSQTVGFVGKTLSHAAFEAIKAFTESCYQRRRGLFERRVADGWIRDCHGDLHLDHIHVTDEALHIYDCIEFNDRFRHLDVASDVAFLAMDLDYHGRPDLARFIVTRLAGLLGDPGMMEADGFLQVLPGLCARQGGEPARRGGNRRCRGEREAAAASARRYFQLALQYAVCGSQPVALVFMGRVASGKSTIAAAVARELGWPLLSSDERRKIPRRRPAPRTRRCRKPANPLCARNDRDHLRFADRGRPRHPAVRPRRDSRRDVFQTAASVTDSAKPSAIGIVLDHHRGGRRHGNASACAVAMNGRTWFPTPGPKTMRFPQCRVRAAG